jgi:hypothetical protein
VLCGFGSLGGFDGLGGFGSLVGFVLVTLHLFYCKKVKIDGKVRIIK